ncbi:MAG: ribosomal-processing cysteine protease Prp [Tepidanaerobacteraceae bacterium]|jgi:uncharacterized protein YsxB (DUF464 family)
MIKIKVFRDSYGSVKMFKVCGHAGYADLGQDIVCAGVSALAETAVIALRELAGLNPIIKKKHGLLLLKLPKAMPDRKLKVATTILDTICLGLEDMSRSYPSFIHMKTIEEV